jgi:hypothetical protein
MTEYRFKPGDRVRNRISGWVGTYLGPWPERAGRSLVRFDEGYGVGSGSREDGVVELTGDLEPVGGR